MGNTHPASLTQDSAQAPHLIGVKPGDPPKVLPESLPDDALIDDNAPRDEPGDPSDPSYPHHTVAPTARIV
jgi:hypothetical protein